MYDAPETRLSLLLRIGNPADEQAWREFVEIYQPVVVQMARRRGLQEADAQDLVQTLLSRVAKKSRQWDSDPRTGSFRGWLATTTRNLVIDHFRQQQRQPGAMADSQWQHLAVAATEEQEYDLQHRRELFQWAAQRCRSEFADKTWQAFHRTSVEQESVAQVAQSLSLTAGAVYIARSRVLARIRAVIQNSDFDSISIP